MGHKSTRVKLMPTVLVPRSTEYYSSPYAEAWELNRVLQKNPCKGDTLILFQNGGTQTVEDFKKKYGCSGDEDTVTDDEEPTRPLKRKKNNPRKKQQSKNTQKTRRKSNRQCKPSVHLKNFEWSGCTITQDPPDVPSVAPTVTTASPFLQRFVLNMTSVINSKLQMEIGTLPILIQCTIHPTNGALSCTWKRKTNGW